MKESIAPKGKTVLPSSLCSKVTSKTDATRLYLSRGRATKDRRRTRLSRRSTLLSFQRPSHWTVATKKPLTRTRGPREVDTEVVSARSKALRSSSDRVLVAARLGRLEDGSRPSKGVNGSCRLNFGSTKPISDAQDRTRTNRRFPAWTTAPASASRGTSSDSATSPSTRTPPCAIQRRASLVETPNHSASAAGR